jgi:hypothetical protein
LPEIGPGPPDIEFSDFIITEQDFMDQLKMLNISKPPGPYDISPRVHETCSSICKPLTKIFNLSLSKKKSSNNHMSHQSLRIRVVLTYLPSIGLFL